MKTHRTHYPQEFPELRGRHIKYPCFAEYKIDGELNWYNANEHGEGSLINKSGKVRFDFPVTNKINDIVKRQGLEGIRFLGELHYGEGKAMALYDLLEHQEDDNLQYSIFDINIRGVTYVERREELTRIFSISGSLPPVSLVPSFYCKSHTDLENVILGAQEQGYEGIVVKFPESKLIMGPCSWVKIKFTTDSSVVVSKIEKDQERIEVLIPGSTKTVGVKVPNKIKATLALGDVVEITHQGILSKGGLRHPVFKRLVFRPQGGSNGRQQ